MMPLSWSPNCRKEIDLDERLNKDSIWNLDNDKMQQRIFNKRRYIFTQEGKANDKDRKEVSKVIGETLLIGNDEMIMKKIDYEALQKRIA